MNKTFYDFYYVANNPPVRVNRDGHNIRHTGSSDRSAFWAGYDGLTGGIFPPTRGSANYSAYRAGRAYRRDVDAGRRVALPVA